MITADQLKEACERAGYRNVRTFSACYSMPSAGWVTSRLGSAFANWLFTTGITYALGEFDCREYVQLAVAQAKAAWRLTPDKPRSESGCTLAVGYCVAPGHMLLVAMHRDSSGNIYPQCYEPQPSVPPGKPVYTLVPMLPVGNDDTSVSEVLFL